MNRSWACAVVLACALSNSSPLAAAQEVSGFEIILPDKIDVALGPGQPGDVNVTLRNTGKTPIGSLELKTSELIDATTMHRVRVQQKAIGAVQPQATVDVTIPLPRPVKAGTYSGALTFFAEGQTKRTVPVVVRSRGPVAITLGTRALFECEYLPLILFAIIALLGFALSSKLDEWFAGGGLRRAEAQTVLNRSRLALVQVLSDVTEWTRTHNAHRLPRTEMRVVADIDEIARLLRQSVDFPVEQLAKEAARFATRAEAAGIFWRTLQFATERLPQEAQLKAVATKLDQIDPDTFKDLAEYRKACLQVVVDQAAAGVERGAMAVGAERNIPVPPRRVEDVDRQITRMAWVYRLTVWLVVSAVAYLTFYDRAFTFGTARDYISVFLWTLGLTQTGTQILARGKSSYTRS